MTKLNDIPKREPFDVPKGYFESLPGRIRARMEAGRQDQPGTFFARYKLQYVVPCLIVLTAVIYWLQPAYDDAEAILATVETDHLIHYLEETGVEPADLLNTFDLDASDIDEIEWESYGIDLSEDELKTMFEPDSL